MKLFISCAEPSGDIIAAEVLASFKKHLGEHPFNIEGIGGDYSLKQGLQSIFPMSDLTVHGLTEVLPKAFQILKRIRQTADHILAQKPDLVITIDAFDFHIRVVKRLRKKGFKGKIVHLVAPAVWAWGGGRAKKLMHYYNGLYCLLPFEPSYFKKEGFKAVFVGNPVLQRFSKPQLEDDFRSRHLIDDKAFVITLLPGSRDSEVKRLLKVFLESIELLQQQIPHLHVVIPTFAQFRSLISETIKKHSFPVTVVNQEEKASCFRQTNFAIAASGTVALELSLFPFPFLIAYKVSKLTAWIARKIVKVNYICLINILMNKSIVPELIQEQCTAQNIYQHAIDLIRDQVRLSQFSKDKTAALSLLEISGQNMPDYFVKQILPLITSESPAH